MAPAHRFVIITATIIVIAIATIPTIAIPAIITVMIDWPRGVINRPP